jgi:hypothetical protein
MPRHPSIALQRALALAVLVALGTAGAPTAFAASSHQPVIAEVRADAAMLRIAGFDLADGLPRVTLGGVALAVTSANATEVVAVVPASITPGTYLLTLTVGHGASGQDNSKYDEAWVTIGAVGVAGPPGKEGPQGATGPQGPIGPQGIPGIAALSTIQSLAGLPCTVAACRGSTAVAFDPLTSGLALTCVRVPGNRTLNIQGGTGVGTKLPSRGDGLRYTSDVPGFAGPIAFRSDQNVPIAFEIPIGGLCDGQPVSITVTRSGDSIATTPLDLVGGSCAPTPLWQSRYLANEYSATCTFTMNANQTLTIQ